jgi:gas vesicle protein
MWEKIILTVVGVVAGAIVAAAVAKIKATAKGRSIKAIKSQIADIEKWREFAQEDIDCSTEERRIVLRALLAALYGLREQGCNGPVNKGIEMLEQYLDTQAHKNRSYIKEMKEEVS